MTRISDRLAAAQRPNVNAQRALLDWYQKNRRNLPWRLNQDPYRVWISEVMLQQTTVNAVIPFYENFLKNFKNIKQLSNAKESEVLKNWSGLGYYSRARNIHRTAKILNAKAFPDTAEELIKLPGFGPYTSRAVSSICFEEKLGVLDGNVIRVLSRFFGLKMKWWLPKERKQLQFLADQLAQVEKPSIWNQAVMELGASICSPQKPACLLCPLKKHCVAFSENLTEQLPLPKPRRTKEIWLWRPKLIFENNKFFFVKNDYAPFLKKHWLPPGNAFLQKSAPSKYLFKHCITHHEIYVTPNSPKRKQSASEAKFLNGIWVESKNISGISPASLISKLISLSI